MTVEKIKVSRKPFLIGVLPSFPGGSLKLHTMKKYQGTQKESNDQ